MARRNGRLSGCLRRLRRDLSWRFAGWRKRGRTWQVLAIDGHEKVAAVEVTVPRVVDENDFAHPFQVEVLRADLVLHRCRSGSED